MIPKIIHYCWFGGNPLPEETKRYIESWKKYCPDYEIKEWNEKNFDVNSNTYVREAYENKKWAFITDYVRLYALYNEGGLYMDTDVELIKSPDSFLSCTAFSGFEDETHIPTALMGSENHGEWVGYLLSYYDDRHFVKPDGTFDNTTNVITITNMTKEKYNIELNNTYQNIEGILTMYPKDYFCPKSYETGNIALTDNTVSIHHFNGSWFGSLENLYLKKQKYYYSKYGGTLGRQKYKKWYRRNRLRLLLMKVGFVGFLKKLVSKSKNYAIKFSMNIISSVMPKIVKTNNTLFFETEGDFCDNGRALFEYMIEHGYNKKYRFVWKVQNINRFKKMNMENVVFISPTNFYESIRLRYYVARARYFFFTHPWWLKKWKKDQTVVTLSHGIPLKGAGKDLSGFLNFHCISSEWSKQLYSKAMGAKDEQMLVIGRPRLDLMYKTIDIKKKLSKYISEDTYQKIILCMPTFRQAKYWTDGEFLNIYSINTISNEDELQELNEFLKNKKMLMIVKVHHLQTLDFMKRVLLSNILYLTDDNLLDINLQLYEMIGYADAMLSDYSSVSFDFLQMNKPIGFFINDIDVYKRGFIMDNVYDYMPGQKIKTNAELFDFLDTVYKDIDDYKDERNALLYKMDDFRDNNNCKRIVEHFNL